MFQLPSAVLCFLSPTLSCHVHAYAVVGISPSGEHLTRHNGEEANKSHCKPDKIDDTRETTRFIPSVLPHNTSLFEIECSHLLIAVREHEEALGRHQPDPVAGRAHKQQVHVITECDEADGRVTARVKPLEDL